MEGRKMVVIDRRIKSGYYTYSLELYEFDGKELKLIASAEYGDLTDMTYDDALKEILRNIPEKGIEIEYHHCGGYFQEPCCIVEPCDDP